MNKSQSRFASSPYNRIKSTFYNFSKAQDILFLYLLALIPRIIFVSITGQADLSLDEIEYDRIAWYLSEGQGFRWYFGLECTYRSPVYPSFLAIIYWMFGPDYYVARIVQTFVIATQSVLTYMIARELFQRRVAVLSGIFVSLYLTLICFSVTLMSENLFISLLLLTVFLLIKFYNNKTISYSIGLGACFALAVLCRPSIAPIAILFLPWFFLPEKNLSKAAKHFLCFSLVVIVPVSGWIYRNYQVTDEIFFIDSRSGYNLYIGYNENSTGSFHMKSASDMLFQHIDNTVKAVAPELTSREASSLFRQELRAYRNRTLFDYSKYDLENAPGDIWFDQWGKEQAFDFIVNNPIQALSLIPKKFMYFWNLEHRLLLFGYSQGVIGNVPVVPLFILFFCLLAPFAFLVIGSILYLTRHKLSSGNLILLTPVAYLTVLHSLTFGDARFHYSLVPILAMFSAAAIGSMKRFNQQAATIVPFTTQRKILAFALICLFVFIWSYGIYESWYKWERVFSPNGYRSRLSF